MNVRIAQLLTFHAGSWYDGSLEMNEYTIKLWMITNTYSEYEQNISIRRLKEFLFGEIENTIFVDSNDRETCLKFIQAGLNVTSMPGDPADQLIGIMLFHKLNAIMEDRIKILEIEISNGSGIVYLHGENETSQELIQPDWWSTADLTHCNSDLSNTEKVLSIAQSTAWRDLDLAWPEEPGNENSGNVVVFANFKPANDTE